MAVAKEKKVVKKKAPQPVKMTPIIEVAMAWYTQLPRPAITSFRSALKLDEPISQQCEDILQKIETSGKVDQTELMSLCFIMLLSSKDSMVQDEPPPRQDS